MTNIQDDQLVNQQPGDNAAKMADDAQETRPKPSKADVDELINQLEALHQEIAAKTVKPASENTEKEDEPVKLEAPPTIPALTSSDEPQLAADNPISAATPTTENKPTSDVDLDQFINDLETKIAEKNGNDNQELSFSEKVRQTTDMLKQNEADIKPEEPEISPPTAIKEETPHLQENSVTENFNQRRPSLDLSGVNQVEPPTLTLNNGQLEENKTEMHNPELQIPPTEMPVETPVEKPVEPVATPIAEVENTDEEALENQNIFTMLDIKDQDETEREKFLEELENLIWDNFIEVELPLLLNSEEKNQADQILADTSKTEDERKEALLVYLEKFIPNLDEVMYKKALTLKKEMFEERLAKMRRQADEEHNLNLMADLDQIQELIKAGRYKTAVELLNKN